MNLKNEPPTIGKYSLINAVKRVWEQSRNYSTEGGCAPKIADSGESGPGSQLRPQFPTRGPSLIIRLLPGNSFICDGLPLSLSGSLDVWEERRFWCLRTDEDFDVESWWGFDVWEIAQTWYPRDKKDLMSQRWEGLGAWEMGRTWCLRDEKDLMSERERKFWWLRDGKTWCLTNWDMWGVEGGWRRENPGI